jgi:DNA-binding transcriptional LysR family regulator
VRTRTLGHDRLRFTVRHGHKVARAARPGLQHLVGYPWVFPIVGTAHFKIAIQRMFEDAGLPAPQATIETGSMQFVKSFVRHTDAVGILSEHVTEAERESGLMVSLPIESAALTRPIGLFDLASAPRPRGVRELMGNLERVFREWERAHPVAPPS